MRRAACTRPPSGRLEPPAIEREPIERRHPVSLANRRRHDRVRIHALARRVVDLLEQKDLRFGKRRVESHGVLEVDDRGVAPRVDDRIEAEHELLKRRIVGRSAVRSRPRLKEGVGESGNRSTNVAAHARGYRRINRRHGHGIGSCITCPFRGSTTRIWTRMLSPFCTCRRESIGPRRLPWPTRWAASAIGDQIDDLDAPDRRSVVDVAGRRAPELIQRRIAAPVLNLFDADDHRTRRGTQHVAQLTASVASLRASAKVRHGVCSLRT